MAKELSEEQKAEKRERARWRKISEKPSKLVFCPVWTIYLPVQMRFENTNVHMFVKIFFKFSLVSSINIFSNLPGNKLAILKDVSIFRSGSIKLNRCLIRPSLNCLIHFYKRYDQQPVFSG